MSFVGMPCFVRFIGQDCSDDPKPPIPPVPGPLDWQEEGTGLASISKTYDLANPFCTLEVAFRFQGTLTGVTATHGGEALQLVQFNQREADGLATAIFIGNNLTIEPASLVVTPVGAATIGPAIGRINDDFANTDTIELGWHDGATGFGNQTTTLVVNASRGGLMKHVWGATTGDAPAEAKPADEHEDLTWGRIVGGNATPITDWSLGQNWSQSGTDFVHTGNVASTLSKQINFGAAGPIGYKFDIDIPAGGFAMVVVVVAGSMTQRVYQGPFNGTIYDMVEGIGVYTAVRVTASGEVTLRSFSYLQNPVRLLGSVGRSVGAIEDGDTLTYQRSISGPYSVSAGEIVAVQYDPDAANAFRRMTTQPTRERKSLYNNFYKALKAAGLYNKMEAMWLTAAHSNQAAFLNLKTQEVVTKPIFPTATATVNGILFARSQLPDGSVRYTVSGTATSALSGYSLPLVPNTESTPAKRGMRFDTVGTLSMSGGSTAGFSVLRYGVAERIGNSLRGAAGVNITGLTSTPTDVPHLQTCGDAQTDNVVPCLTVTINSGVTVNYSFTVHKITMARNYDLQGVNSPTWTLDRGISGNGTTNYFTTGVIPTLATLPTVDNTHVSTWITQSTPSAGATDMGALYSAGGILIRAAESPTTAGYRVNSTATLLPAIQAGTGFGLINRLTSAVSTIWKNGVLAATNTAASSVAPNVDIYIGALNNSYTPQNFSARRVSFASYGVGLSDAEIGTLNTIVGTFLRAVGAIMLPETEAVIGRMNATPSDTRKGLINNLISALISGGVWSRLDALWVMAAHDSQAAAVNWISGNFTAAQVNSPVFTADRGFAGNGTSSYLNTGYVPGAVGTQATPEDHVGGVVVQSGIGMNNNFVFGNTTFALTPQNSASFITARSANTNTTLGTVTVPTDVGHSTFMRINDGSLNVRFYRNGVFNSQSARGLGSLSNEALYVGGLNNANTFTLGNTRRVSILYGGKSLTDTQLMAAQNAFNTYLTAVGA